jgi:hypothetical protein
VFPIAPRFNPICFAQSPPLNEIYEWAKGGRHCIFLKNLLFWGAFIISTYFFDGPIAGKKKAGLVRHPQLINMKQNNKKCPQFIIGIFSLGPKRRTNSQCRIKNSA